MKRTSKMSRHWTGRQEVLQSAKQIFSPDRIAVSDSVIKGIIDKIEYRGKEKRIWGDRKSTRLNSSHM